MPERQAIIIAGMHRSGTSAFTRAAALMGAELPCNLVPPGIDNPAGFWESQPIVTFNDQLLAILNCHWHSLQPLHEDWLDRLQNKGMIQRAVELLKQEFPGGNLLLIKDPRLCRIFPFWAEVLAQMKIGIKVILPFRNPLEVAASLQKRNHFSERKGLLLWLRYMVDAEYHTRSTVRCFVAYQQLLDAPLHTMNEIGGKLGIKWPRQGEPQLKEFVSPGLRNHTSESNELLKEPGFYEDIGRVYQAYDSVSEEGSRPLTTIINQARYRLNELAGAFSESTVNTTGIDTARLLAEERELTRKLAEKVSRYKKSLVQSQESLKALEAQTSQQKKNGSVDIEYNAIKYSGLFDKKYYLGQGVRLQQEKDPIRHYLAMGSYQGVDPHPLFSTSYYAAQNQTASGNMNPLYHYIRFGSQRLQNPHPAFNAFFYALQVPELFQGQQNALQHYVKTRGRTAEPSPFFNTERYLQNQKGSNFIDLPLHHWLNHGGVQKTSAGKGPVTPANKLNIVIGVVTYNNSTLQMHRLARSIEKATTGLDIVAKISLVFIDNGTASGLEKLVEGASPLQTQDNTGYTRALNQVLQHSFNEVGADLVIMANPDGAFHHAAIKRMLEHHHSAPRALIEAVQFPEEHPKIYNPVTFETNWASGCCLLIPAEIYRKTGPFDENFFQYMEDVDYSWRVKSAGYSVQVCPGALFYHNVLNREPDFEAEKHMLKSGRYLAHKWGNDEFRQICEEELQYKGFYSGGLPTLPKIENHQYYRLSKSSNFDHSFSFSFARW